jgi:CHAT domain-containing protein
VTPSLLARRPASGPAAAEAGRAAAISAGASRSGLPPLAYAGAEAQMVARHARAADLLLDATEGAVRALDLSRYDLVHFASHSLLNDARPDRSAIVLGADAREDGLLQAREIYRLPLRARLVVLSSCESGLGTLVGGEGMLGLVHALLSAGSGAVLAALWRIPDAGAAEFMTRFYDRAAGPGVTAARALQQAQAEAAGAGAHPAAWAGYAVFGDADQPLPLRKPRGSLPWLLGAGVIVVLLLLALRRQRTR